MEYLETSTYLKGLFGSCLMIVFGLFTLFYFGCKFFYNNDKSLANFDASLCLFVRLASVIFIMATIVESYLYLSLFSESSIGEFVNAEYPLGLISFYMPAFVQALFFVILCQALGFDFFRKSFLYRMFLIIFLFIPINNIIFFFSQMLQSQGDFIPSNWSNDRGFSINVIWNLLTKGFILVTLIILFHLIRVQTKTPPPA